MPKTSKYDDLIRRVTGIPGTFNVEQASKLIGLTRMDTYQVIQMAIGRNLVRQLEKRTTIGTTPATYEVVRRERRA